MMNFFKSLILMVGLVCYNNSSALPFNDLASFSAASGPLSFVDFEGGVSGTDIGGDYAGLGVSFSSGNTYSGCTGCVSGLGGWLNNTSSGNDRIFDADFILSGIRAVGVTNTLNAQQPFGGLLEAFDAADNLLASVMSDMAGNTLDFFGVTTNVDIARIQMTSINPNGWLLDDLYFSAAKTTSPVPEPSIIALFAAGLFGLGFARRRKA